MPSYIKVLQPIEIYNAHTLGAQVVKKLFVGELILFNREKRRNNINWMEVYLDDHTKGYIQKDNKKIFVCQYAKLNDHQAIGFDYEMKNIPHQPFMDIFKPLRHEVVPYMVEMKRMEDQEKSKMEYLKFGYDHELVEVKKFAFYKNETFYVTNKDFFNGGLVEVDDLNGRKGFLLPKTSYTETKDQWMIYLAYIIMAVVILAIVAGFWIAGWLVVGTILIIPALIVAAVLIFAVKIVLMILNGIFNQIRKRF